MLGDLGVSTLCLIKIIIQFSSLFWIIIPAILPATMLRYYSMSASLTPLSFFIVVSIYWKSTSYRSSLNLSSFDKATNRSAAKLICFSFFLDRRARYSTCRWLQDFVMTLSRSLRLVRHGYPWLPIDQAHDSPRQVGPAHLKTRRPVSRPV
jgi:hypothetical protein